MKCHQLYWVALWAGATGAGLMLGNYIHESQSTKTIPPTTERDKVSVQLDAIRRTQEAILIYVRPDENTRSNSPRH